MPLPLKKIRERASNGGQSLSQQELAIRINISQGQVSRYENDPESIPFETALAWCQACGLGLEEALREQGTANHRGLNPDEPYQALHSNLELLRRYVRAAPQIPSDLSPVSIRAEDLLLKVEHWSRKPTLLITGRFDSGKTRIANTLLGSDNLPSQYTPTTGVVTFVRHLTDRPEWQKEDVWIMKKGFDPGKWTDQEHCQEFRLVSGGYESLRRFGTKDSEGEELGATAALVYMNSPALHACTLIDVPGFQDNAEDGELAMSSASLADILVYTSPAKGFLDASDFLHLGYLLSALSPIRCSRDDVPYRNFFLVATHADPSISDEQLELILDRGGRRLFRHLGDSVLAGGDHRISETQLRKRMFPFWYESPSRRQSIELDLTDTLSRILPATIKKRVDDEVKDIKAKTRSDLRKRIDSYEKALSEIDAARHNIHALRERLPLHMVEVARNKAKFKLAIEEMRGATTRFAETTLAPSIQPGNVESFIRKHWQKAEKDDAKKDALAKLLQDMQSNFDGFLARSSEQLKPLVENYLREYSMSSNSLQTVEVGDSAQFSDIGIIPFDTQGAFAGGLAGAGTLGALGVWASTMGNLGGYILVAKLASVLSVAGISVGSSALVSFVAAIGGPVTLAVGIAALATMGIWSLFGESWQTRLAKKIAKLMQERLLIEKFKQKGDEYWTNSLRAFECGAVAIEEKFSEYLANNEALLSDSDAPKKIEAAITALEDLRDFFGGIPWRSPE